MIYYIVNTFGEIYSIKFILQLIEFHKISKQVLSKSFQAFYLSKLYSLLILGFALIGLSFTSGTDPLEIGETSPAFAELTTDLDGNNKVLREASKILSR